jgi:hypothetical protein
VLGKIYVLAGYTGPVGFGSHAAEDPAATEVPRELAVPPVVVTTPNHDEDLEEELEEEQAGEDEEVAVLGAVFSLLNMSFDVQHRQEE